MKLDELKAKANFTDLDEVREKLVGLGSAADVWMGEPNLKLMMKHLNDGGQVKADTIDTAKAEDKHAANEMMDKRVNALTTKGWQLFDFEWDDMGDSVDVILIKK